MENLSGTNYKKQYPPDFLPVVFWAILLFFTEYAINQRRLKLFQNDEMSVIALYCKSFVNFFKAISFYEVEYLRKYAICNISFGDSGLNIKDLSVFKGILA